MTVNAMMRGMAWMTDQLRRHAGVPVEYERVDPETGEVRTLTVTATLGRPSASREGAVAPMELDANAVDFLIAAEALTLDGERFEPRRDDRIRMAMSDRVNEYKLLPQGSHPPWRWSDPMQTLRRIHTKLFDSEASP